MSDVFGKHLLTGDAVYWPPSTQVGDNGQPIYDPPTEIKCFWDETSEIYNNVANRQITQEVSNAVIMVDRDLEEQGMIIQGTLNTINDQNDPMNNDKVWEIRKVEKTPIPRKRKFARFVMV